MPKTEMCRHCHHASYAHINGECVAHDQQGTCGCVRVEAIQRKPRQRTWIVAVASSRRTAGRRTWSCGSRRQRAVEPR